MSNLSEAQRYLKIKRLAHIQPPRDLVPLLECKNLGKLTGGSLNGYYVWDFHAVCALPEQDLDYWLRLVEPVPPGVERKLPPLPRVANA